MKFFLTGATGFVGSHLTKKLISNGEKVTALINKTPSPKFIDSMQTEINTVKANLLDTESLAEAMIGHDVVVHLAYGNKGTPEQQYRITVQGTKSVLNAVSQAKVKRFIYLSTISVYGEPPKNTVYTEESPRYASMDLYSSLKQEAELVVLNTPRQDTEIVVLQPGIIYGPEGGYWSKGMLDILSKQLFPLFDDGQGLCNLIHIYDVVDAIILASASDINDECFIITDNQPITWKQFFESYEGIVAKQSLIRIPPQIMRKINLWSQYSYQYVEYRLYAKMFKIILRLMQFPRIFSSLHFMNSDRINFFTAKPHFSNKKAKEMLGFNPKINVEDGMKTVKEWFMN